MLEHVNKYLREYVEKNILTQYDTNIGGHNLAHINQVISRSFELAEEFQLDVDPDIVYTVAAFHDIGYKIDPDNHEELSAKMFLEDSFMEEYFIDETRVIIAEAIIDHRASLEYEARTLYGKLVSSADREISVDNMLKRSMAFQADKHQAENPAPRDVIEYSYKKLSSKYGKGGYAKMYFADAKYLEYLELMQSLLDDKEKFTQYEMQLMDDNLKRKLTFNVENK